MFLATEHVEYGPQAEVFCSTAILKTWLQFKILGLAIAEDRQADAATGGDGIGQVLERLLVNHCRAVSSEDNIVNVDTL